MYVLSAGETPRYKAKVLVTDSTQLESLLSQLYIASRLLAGWLIVQIYIVTKVHAAACLVSNQTTPY